MKMNPWPIIILSEVVSKSCVWFALLFTFFFHLVHENLWLPVSSMFFHVIQKGVTQFTVLPK